MADREIILTPEGFQRLKEEIEYLSSVMTLEPGDVIATGTPAEIRANAEVKRAYLGDEAAA